MKHAYLIIAHNEFVILQKLINVLDDDRIDIFVLIDRKVTVLPYLYAKKSKLKILDDRINIHWGHHSQIWAELRLFKEVYKQGYEYCHLISGVHLPLYSKAYLFEYFEDKYPAQVFTPIATNETEKNFKVKLRSFFIQYYRHPNPLIARFSQYAWVLLLKFQKLFGLERNYFDEYIKYSNWVSITQNAVDEIISKEAQIYKEFKYTFCADEFFVPTVLKNSLKPFDFYIENRFLYQVFENTRAKVMKTEDYEAMIDSQALFGRKFSENAIEVVNKIIDNYKNR